MPARWAVRSWLSPCFSRARCRRTPISRPNASQVGTPRRTTTLRLSGPRGSGCPSSYGNSQMIVADLWTSRPRARRRRTRCLAWRSGSIPEGARVRPTPPPRDDRAPTCPDWCRRDHDAGDGVDDLLHQSDPAHVAVVHGDPRFAPRENAWPDAVVLRLAQRPGSTTVWL